MDNYIKTIINGLKAWVSSCLSRLETSVSKLSGNLDTLGSKITSLSNKVQQAKTTADNAQTTATNAQATATNAQTTANEAKTAATNAQTTANGALQKTGGTMTGQLVCRDLVLGPAANATNRIRIRADSYTDYGKMILSNSDGDATISFAKNGTEVEITGIATPTEGSGAANKEYVDAKIKTYRGNELFFLQCTTGSKAIELPIDATALSYYKKVYVMVGLVGSTEIQTVITSVKDVNGVALPIGDGSLTLDATCVLRVYKGNGAITVDQVASL